MSRAPHPTLSELRTRVQKQRHREIGSWLARKVARPSAVYGTWLAIRLGLSANQVTCLALGASLASAISIGTGSRPLFVVGVLLGHLAFWLDHVDGQVARWRGTSSLDGVFFDYLLHYATNLSLGFALGQGLAMRANDPLWSVAGFAIAAGWTFLNLANDCRYKAFIQRLKSYEGAYRVEGGAGGRPAPPTPWPRRGRGMFTWPAYKLCEPHVVLIGLTVLALIAAVSPDFWLICWRLSVRSMCILAPVLALARLARLVAKNQTTNEFERWFQPQTIPLTPAVPDPGHGES